MTLSNTCKAAIKSVIYLASKRKVSDDNSTIKEISLEVGENEHTVGKLLQTLVKQGIINSIKGPSGGFFVSEEQINLPLLDVVEAIDGKGIFTKCGLGLSKCSKSHPCPIHFEYKEARDLVENLFKEKRVADMCKSINNGKTFLSD